MSPANAFMEYVVICCLSHHKNFRLCLKFVKFITNYLIIIHFLYHVNYGNRTSNKQWTKNIPHHPHARVTGHKLGHIPRFPGHQLVAGEGFWEEQHYHMISCRTSIHQSYRKSVLPVYQRCNKLAIDKGKPCFIIDERDWHTHNQHLFHTFIL